MRRGLTQAENRRSGPTRSHDSAGESDRKNSPAIIRVKVRPNSRRSSFDQRADGTWFAELKALPVDGRANEELVALIAAHFKCRRSDVVIKSGASGRLKLVRVERAGRIC